jgi:hypothetical protein
MARLVQAKFEFEKYARTYGANIRQYHAGNGQFSDNSLQNDGLSKGQLLTFCGVGAHHQNGQAEKRIRDIQDLARTSHIYMPIINGPMLSTQGCGRMH